MIDELNALLAQAKDELSNARDEAQVEAARIKFLGKKGSLSAVLRGMGKLAADERPRVGEVVNSVKAGNATPMISETCDKALETCEFFADLGRLQDPAPGCDKDLAVQWRCGRAEKVNSVRIAARADGKFVSLRCP